LKSKKEGARQDFAIYSFFVSKRIVAIVIANIMTTMLIAK